MQSCYCLRNGPLMAQIVTMEDDHISEHHTKSYKISVLFFRFTTLYHLKTSQTQQQKQYQQDRENDKSIRAGFGRHTFLPENQLSLPVNRTVQAIRRTMSAINYHTIDSLASLFLGGKG